MAIKVVEVVAEGEGDGIRSLSDSSTALGIAKSMSIKLANGYMHDGFAKLDHQQFVRCCLAWHGWLVPLVTCSSHEE